MNQIQVRILAGVTGIAIVGAGLFFAAQNMQQSAPTTAELDERMSAAEEAYGLNRFGEVLDIMQELAEEGMPLAQYRLGLMYANGLGVEVDESVAMRWLERSVEAEFEDARGPLIEMYMARAVASEDLAAGFQWYERAARLGQPEAQAVLGSYYFTGSVVERDMNEGLRLLRLAADAGDPRAQSNLGYAYASGTGVNRDDEEAFRWYLAAAESGLVRAQAAVGLFYETGRGVESSLPDAIRWYLNAYEAGAPGVAEKLGQFVADGVIDAAFDDEASIWVQAAARSGSASAIANSRD